MQERILHNMIHVILRPLFRCGLPVHKLQDPPLERDHKAEAVLQRKTSQALFQILSRRHLPRLRVLVVLLLGGVDIRAHHCEPVLLKASVDLPDEIFLPDLHIVVHHNDKVRRIFAHRVCIAEIVAFCKTQVLTGLQYVHISGVLVLLLKSLYGPVWRTVIHDDDLLFTFDAAADRLHTEDRLLQRHVVQYNKTYHFVYSSSRAGCPSSSAL